MGAIVTDSFRKCKKQAWKNCEKLRNETRTEEQAPSLVSPDHILHHSSAAAPVSPQCNLSSSYIFNLSSSGLLSDEPNSVKGWRWGDDDEDEHDDVRGWVLENHLHLPLLTRNGWAMRWRGDRSWWFSWAADTEVSQCLQAKNWILHWPLLALCLDYQPWMDLLEFKQVPEPSTEWYFGQRNFLTSFRLHRLTDSPLKSSGELPRYLWGTIGTTKRWSQPTVPQV